MPEHAELRVRLQPRASRSEVAGRRGGVLLLRVTAPPVDGAANAACRDLLAEWLGLRRSDVTLASGERSRDKLFRVSGLTPEALRARIQARLPRDLSDE